MVLDTQAVAEQLKEERQSRKLDQHTLAVMVGVKRTSITNIENGRQALSLNLFCKLADALGKHPSDLLRDALNRRADIDVSDLDVPNAEIRRLINNVLRKGEG
jgi:transcriptional regulator with XRE-family HTH domain